jgi:hypothetical protein
MQELEPKMQGGLIREGGVFAGFYGTYYEYEYYDISSLSLQREA